MLIYLFLLAILSSCANRVDEQARARIAPYCKYKMDGGLHAWCVDPKVKPSCECPPPSDVKQPVQELNWYRRYSSVLLESGDIRPVLFQLDCHVDVRIDLDEVKARRGA